MNWRLLWGYFSGPRVYRKYSDDTVSSSLEITYFRSNLLEELCDCVMEAMETCRSIAFYTSPVFVIIFATHRGVFHLKPEALLKCGLRLALLYGGAYFGRGVGRAMSKDYSDFLRTFLAASQLNNAASVESNSRSLRRYDFDFRYWPIDYQWRNADKDGRPILPRRSLPQYQPAADEHFLKRLVLDGLSFIVARTVLYRSAYPGLAFPTILGRWAFEEGRAKIVEEMDGQRFKLRCRLGNEIDTMFVDRRNDRRFANGCVLVITCEGNSGFYERGLTAAAPLKAEYSVLMWNHPGFGNSTGWPRPPEEASAIDVVVQFALTELRWREIEIVIYGWSIGSFTATWAAMNYRNIRALILDATFDDSVPLAQRALPRSWAPFVEHTMRSYMNLDIEAQLAEYDGPVLLIRRLQDEVMAVLEHAPDVPTLRKVNRLNYLLESLLFRRYPKIFRDDDAKRVVDDWLAATEEERPGLLSEHDVDPNHCRAILASYIEERAEESQPEAPTFPLTIGADLDLVQRREIALYLVSEYFAEVDSDHGSSLPAEKFLIPHQPWE